MSDLKKNEECSGCIGLTNEHTCEGYDDFLKMKAEYVKATHGDNTVQMIQLAEAVKNLRAENERLKAQIKYMRRPGKSVAGYMQKAVELDHQNTELSDRLILRDKTIAELKARIEELENA